MATPSAEPQSAPQYRDVKRKLVRGAIIAVVLVAVAVGIISVLPGLGGIRSAIGGASPGWVLAAVGIQLVGITGAVVFVQAVYVELPKRLSWRQGWAQQAANSVLPTAGSTAVGWWTVSSVGWTLERFADRAAVMIIAPGAPNVLLLIVVGLGMGSACSPAPTMPCSRSCPPRSGS
jgi:hypothetical protein